MPWPDFVVGDVGTTIAQMKDRKVSPIAALETEIAQAWADRGARVRAALDGHPGLTLQTTAFRYRVSYDMDAGAFDNGAVHIADDLGADALISDNRFFDVLPRGVSKGPSLLLLVEYLGVARTRVLAAGDTLNDLSMLVAPACSMSPRWNVSLSRQS
ncbi:HAD family hydrolase [Yoonia sp.]|uniref:HAD family hydrolase n=1 Tax=Yoonia sp. TaxID=2212373 RepID=UPI00345B53F1